MAFEISSWGMFQLQNTSINEIDWNMDLDLIDINFIAKVLIMLDHPS